MDLDYINNAIKDETDIKKKAEIIFDLTFVNDKEFKESMLRDPQRFVDIWCSNESSEEYKEYERQKKEYNRKYHGERDYTDDDRKAFNLSIDTMISKLNKL